MNWKASQVLNIKPLHNAPSRDAAYASEGPHPAGQDTHVWDLCCLTDLCELSGGFYIVIHESCDTQGILSVPMLTISQRYIARGPMLIVFTSHGLPAIDRVHTLLMGGYAARTYLVRALL